MSIHDPCLRLHDFCQGHKAFDHSSIEPGVVANVSMPQISKTTCVSDTKLLHHWYSWTMDTYTFPGPVIVAHVSLVQNSEITPYIRFTWLKNDTTEIQELKYHKMNMILPKKWQNDTGWKKFLFCMFLYQNIKRWSCVQNCIDLLLCLLPVVVFLQRWPQKCYFI